MLTIRAEDVGRSETHRMVIFQPDTITVESPVSPVPQATMTGQDADNGAHSVVSQAGGVTSVLPYFFLYP